MYGILFSKLKKTFRIKKNPVGLANEMSVRNFGSTVINKTYNYLPDVLRSTDHFTCRESSVYTFRLVTNFRN